MSESLEVEVTAPVETETPEPSTPEPDVKETEEDSQAESKPEEKPKKPLTEAQKKAHALEKRVARQTAANRAAQEKIAEQARQLQELQQKIPEQANNEPSEADFNTWEEYNEALINHRTEQKVNERLAEQKQAQLQAEMQKQQQQQALRLQKQEEAFRTEHADYDKVKGQADLFYKDVVNRLGENHPTLQRLVGDVLDTDIMPELFYEIGNNPDFLDELVSLSPAQASFKLFEFKQSLVNETPEQAKLPTPIKSTKASGSSSKPLAKASGEDILKWINS